MNYQADRLTVKLNPVSQSLVWRDVASLQANYPFDGSLLVFYFEMTPTRISEGGYMAIGLSGQGFPLNKIPGLTEMAGFSIGYVSTGDVVTSSGDHLKFKKFKEGDVIGCGLNSYSNEIFFTLNGVLWGSLMSSDKTLQNRAEGELFATVGMQGVGSELRVNFGRQPLAFDLAGMIQGTKRAIMK